VAEQRLPMSRRGLLAGGLAGTSAAVVLALTGSSVADAAGGYSTGHELVDAKVDLLVDQVDTLVISGTINGTPVHARGSLFGGPHGGPATVIGSMTKQPLAAIMTLRDQAPDGSGYVTSARLTASLGDDAMVLSGTFNLDKEFDFKHGVIDGSDRGSKVEFTLQPHASGYGARIRGRFAGTAVAITATVQGGSDQPGSVIGSVGGKRVDLKIEAARQAGTRITGTFNGPSQILALIAGAVAYFS
jgi:hypothetical protein